MDTDTLPSWLTASPAKAERYQDDIWMRESWFDALMTLPEPRETLLRTTYLVVKPEALATRQATRLLSLVEARGFTPLDAVPLRLDRQRIRALWQYQLNSAGIATLAAVDLIATAGPVLAVLLRDELAGTPTDAPGSASARLSAMKGSTHGERRDDDLRVVLGGTVPLFSFVHVADDPADLVRELAIWFDRPEREQVYRQLDAASRDGSDVQPAHLAPVVALAEDGTEATDLDWRRALNDLGNGPPPAPELAARIRERLTAGDSAGADDREMLPLVRELADLECCPVWDRITLASMLVSYQRPVRAPLL